MVSERSVDSRWWDLAFDRQGHTGWADKQVYAYDQPLRRKAVAALVRRVHPRGLDGLRAVDVGCGTGDFAAILHALGADVTAFDFSPRVIEAARKRFPEGTHRLNLLRASATEIPASDHSAAVVTCITVLQHLVNEADLRRAVLELRRVLRSDGHAIVLELAPPLDRPNLSPDGHVIERPANEWTEIFEACGLRIVGEAVYPQYGITGLRLIARVIDRLRREAKPEVAGVQSHAAVNERGLSRRVMRGGLSVVRLLWLAVAWPLDHLVFLPVPKSLRYYRLWILKPSEGGH